MMGFRLAGARLSLAVLAVLAVSSTAARADIWRCVNKDGVIEYSNSKPARERLAKCRQIDLPSLTTIPAPKTPPSARAGSRGDGLPKVDSNTQKARDDDRREILERELRKEQTRLDALKAEFNGGEPERQGNERNYQKYLDRIEGLKRDIASSESNVGSLRRELDALR